MYVAEFNWVVCNNNMYKTIDNILTRLYFSFAHIIPYLDITVTCFIRGLNATLVHNYYIVKLMEGSSQGYGW